eukprot:TRINITY_DN52517_c0_g1_i1.p1 TRINITY_DN52517_c0_g1~~TRINITY_DN52517_c0_g1_i1.p1  ORF type:complete len:207 (-),score=46.69 TRINITY_DN52517_c0_g1_i1:150-719(-)
MQLSDRLFTAQTQASQPPTKTGCSKRSRVKGIKDSLGRKLHSSWTTLSRAIGSTRLRSRRVQQCDVADLFDSFEAFAMVPTPVHNNLVDKFARPADMRQRDDQGPTPEHHNLVDKLTGSADVQQHDQTDTLEQSASQPQQHDPEVDQLEVLHMSYQMLSGSAWSQGGDADSHDDSNNSDDDDFAPELSQ